MSNKSKEVVLKQLGETVRNRRLEKKYSQLDLAAIANIDISTLSRLERGILNGRFDTYYKIALVLNLEMKDLFDF